MESIELKNTMTKIKHLLDNLNSRREIAKDIFNKFRTDT